MLQDTLLQKSREYAWTVFTQKKCLKENLPDKAGSEFARMETPL